ncbi:MAG: peptidylprolyl isomerase [Planctomycetes bacterium]|nr:peptidylprolyl isomerase [Planctomycetota bacterium]
MRGRTAVLALLAACSSPPPPAPAPAVRQVGASAPAVRQIPPLVPVQDEFPPSILLPDQAAADDEVARVGDLVLRRSHAFARLMTADPKLALETVDLLVFDALVARHAEQFGIRVETATVIARAEQQEQELLRQLRADFGADADFAAWVWRIFGMRLADWRAVEQIRTAQRLYQGYTLRYLALREDRVVVRYIVHTDHRLLAQLAEQVALGADFATLALRHSDDALRREGGLLPAFGAGFQHPVAEVALGLQPGAVSPVFEREVGGEKRHFLVFCKERLAGRDLPFAAVAEEIDRDLVARPLTPLEINAYMLRWRGALASPPPPPPAGR